MIKTYKGHFYCSTFYMLPEKLSSRIAAREGLAATQLSTPRRIARFRGRALHYGCAIPFVAVAAPSLSQLMHRRETSTGPVDVPALDDETEMEFDYDGELPVSDRVRQALEFRRIGMEKYRNASQPLLPVSPSSLYGSFLTGDVRDALVLMIIFDDSVHGWAAGLRASPDGPGVEIVGGYSTEVDSLGAAFFNPAALPEFPAARCIGSAGGEQAVFARRPHRADPQRSLGRQLAVACKRSLIPLAFITDPGMWIYSGGAAPRSIWSGAGCARAERGSPRSGLGGSGET